MECHTSGRHARRLAASILAIFAIGAEPAAAQSLPTDAVFSPSSFWYTQIPAYAPLHPNSANYVKEFLRQKTAYYGNVSINTWSYSSPVYTVDSIATTVSVTQWDCQRKGFLDAGLKLQWATVPIPDYAAPASGTDGEMTIYQPATGTIWEFWRASKDSSGQWKACWGGRMQYANSGNGIWPAYYGVTATGLPFLGGQITAEELVRGEIRHAIGIALVDVEAAKIFSWPAVRSDGYNPQNLPNRIPEGLRFRLDPAVNVDSLPMTAAGKTIAKAAQKYGFVVWDRAGSLSLRVQNPLSYTLIGQTNPYPALFGGKPAYAVLDGFPWDKLQFLPMNYGKP